MELKIVIRDLKPMAPPAMYDIKETDEVHDLIADKLANDIVDSLKSHENLEWDNEEFDITIMSE